MSFSPAALQHPESTPVHTQKGPSFRHWVPAAEQKNQWPASPTLKQTGMQTDAHIAANRHAHAQPCSPNQPYMEGRQHGVSTKPYECLVKPEEWHSAVGFNPQYAVWLQQARQRQAMAQANHGH